MLRPLGCLLLSLLGSCVLTESVWEWGTAPQPSPLRSARARQEPGASTQLELRFANGPASVLISEDWEAGGRSVDSTGLAWRSPPLWLLLAQPRHSQGASPPAQAGSLREVAITRAGPPPEMPGIPWLLEDSEGGERIHVYGRPKGEASWLRLGSVQAPGEATLWRQTVALGATPFAAVLDGVRAILWLPFTVL